MPTFALRGKGDLGVGDTASLMEFVDWAAAVGFRLVKLLPINETGGDHSPYNALSSRALEPTTLRLDPATLPDLKASDYAALVGAVGPAALDSDVVDYDVVKPLKRRLLEAAFARFERNHTARRTKRAAEFAHFADAQAEWLEDYALFRTLFDLHGGERWDKWPEAERTPTRLRAALAVLPARKAQAFAKKVRFFSYVQWLAFEQWRKVKAHAASRGVALMGDIPFGVSYHSADVWSEPQLFRRGWCGGTPPDTVFKHDPFVVKWGQNWGIPLYDWDAMRADGFGWWRRRVRGVREFFDLFRIDHVLGFYRIYGFPWRPEENGIYLPLSLEEASERTGGVLPGFQPRPDDVQEDCDANCLEGEEYLRILLHEAGAGSVIGEDLGVVPNYVRPNLTSLGIAGYKIPAWEKLADGHLIPGSQYQRLSLATYGTHDHHTLKAYWEELLSKLATAEADGARWEMRILWEFAGGNGEPPDSFTPELHRALLRALFRSNSWIVVAMITDVFGRSERFNLPGTASGANWTQRIHAPIAELDADAVVPWVREELQAAGRAL